MKATTTLESVASTMKRYPDPDNDKTEADSIQQWKVPDKIVYAESCWANKHKTHELEKDDGARSGRQVRAKWVADKQRQQGQKRTGQVAVGRECGAECRS